MPATPVGAHRYSSGWSVPKRKMLIGRSLRIPARPSADDQSLIGFVADRVAFHALGDVNGVLRRAGISMDYPGSLSKLDPDILVGLAPILGCTEDDVRDRATPLLRSDAMVSSVTIATATLPAYDLETGRRRISPVSLRAEAHHRQSWMIRLLPYCPRSLELLRDDCSHCGAPLRWKASQGVARCDSEACGQVVEPTDAPPLDSAFADGYRLFASLLSSSAAERDGALARLPNDVRRLDATDLLEMVIHLGSCVEGGDRRIGRKSLRRLPPEHLARICAVGAAMMRSWPDGLRSWADEEVARLRGDHDAVLRLRSKVRRLGRRFSVSDAQAELVKSAFPDLFANLRRGFARPNEILLCMEASSMLRITPPTLMEMVDRDFVPCERMGRAQSHVRFRRSDIAGLCERMATSMSAALLARTTHLPVYAIRHLIAIGALSQEADPAVDFLRNGPSVTMASVNAAARAMEGHRRASCRPVALQPLGTAVRRIGGRLKPWAEIVAALSDGSLPFWCDGAIRSSTPWTRAILVRSADVAAFDNVIPSMPDGRAWPSPENCSLQETREILNISGIPSIDLQTTFADEIAERAQFGPRVSISMDSVLRMARDSISVAEICARTGWNQRRAKWRLKPHEACRTQCGWKRRVIEASGLLP